MFQYAGNAGAHGPFSVRRRRRRQPRSSQVSSVLSFYLYLEAELESEATKNNATHAKQMKSEIIYKYNFIVEKWAQCVFAIVCNWVKFVGLFKVPQNVKE